MRINIYLLITIALFLVSCSSKGTFKQYYNQNKKEADYAFAFPKYLAMIAVPGDSKEDIQRFSKGMRKIRLLVNDNNTDELISSFKAFSKGKEYTPYLVVKQDGSEVNLFAKEEGDLIREIVLDIRSEDGAFVVGLLGKMERKTFQAALAEASNR